MADDTTSRPCPALGRLLEIVRRLRAPDGCPWDRAQTHRSIVKNLVEECGEFIDALEEDNLEGVREELGDLLLQVALHGQIAEEAGEFTLEEVADEEARKLVRRHPHVFGEKRAADAAEALAFWNASKAGEGGEQARRKGPMDGVPRSIPGLSRIQKALRKAQKANLLTVAEQSPAALAAQISETLSALPQERRAEDAAPDAALEARLQALLLQTVQLCHAYGCEAEEVAHHAAKAYIKKHS